MKMINRNYETVTEVVNDLVKRGYTFDFIVEENECIVCKDTDKVLSPEDFEIDEVFRFEGQTSPDDEDVVYAISSAKDGVKGIVVNSYGAYSDTRVDKLLERLRLQYEQKAKPIRRHKSIEQFSREHHFGLLLSWKIRQGITLKVPAKRIAAYTLFFFEEELQKHFKAEEDLLFKTFASDDLLVAQATNEHAEIYHMIRLIKEEEPGYDILQNFAALLEKHIRFEERVLFNYIQSKLPEDRLLLVEELHGLKSDDPDNKWPDHFWDVKN
jgi:hypothetical protein